MQSSFALVQHIAALFPLGKRNTHAPNLNKLHVLEVSSSALEVKRNSPPLPATNRILGVCSIGVKKTQKTWNTTLIYLRTDPEDAYSGK